MKRIYLLFIALLSGFVAARAQSSEDYTVEVSATVSESPVKITLNWKLLTVDAPTYQIFKKSATATAWGSSIATLPSTVGSFIDTNVIIDSAYEYFIYASGVVSGSSLISTGYCYAGIRRPAMHNRGIMLFLVDSTFLDSCSAGITTMMQDLSGDGWQLIRHDFGRTATDVTIKAAITADYTAHANVNAALILGHLAVPYSGGFDNVSNPPDGHVPQHDGAWPADIYYSCITTGWTDVSVNNSLASFSANWNIPGDGKWDQIYIPSPAKIQIGRVDFFNMPAFGTTENAMMNSYLNRDHIYKMDSLYMRRRAVLHDDFGAFGGEAFAANGWRNFAPLLTKDSTTVVPANTIISSLQASTYQWAYGCGGGSFTSAGGIGNTTDWATGPVNGIFNMFFGSYFADWNVQNSFLRAPLCASTPALTNCWAGRPNWFFHHMALGYNIGFSTLLSQNNNGTLYQPGGYGNQFIHVALMGDPSLRTDYVQPITGLTISTVLHGGATLNWTPSADTSVIGYNVYRADSVYGYFTLLNTTMLASTTTTFHDTTGHFGLKYYMVRPVKLQSTPSGRYYNMGIGVTDTAYVTYSVLSVAGTTPSVKLNVFPNPASNFINVAINTAQSVMANIYITTITGERLFPVSKELNKGANEYRLNIGSLSPGIYSVVVEYADRKEVQKWIKN